MISSAVVIPEQDPEQQLPSPSLKRRQSSISSDSSKRPRLDTQDGPENGSRVHIESPMSPPSKRRSLLGSGAAEEKKRGQRLFGALLGTLSQKSSKPVHKKRDEVEQRQRERMRKDAEQREEEQRRKREELEKLRQSEQRIWDKESTRIRHRNMRATAEFLQTKAEPRLYYKPWELREEEQILIKRQIREVEQVVREELGEDTDVETRNEHPRNGRHESESIPDSHDDQMESKTEDAAMAEEDSGAKHKNDDEETPESTKIDTPDDSETQPADSKAPEDERPKEDDHAGEELVEGQEDDVIY